MSTTHCQRTHIVSQPQPVTDYLKHFNRLEELNRQKVSFKEAIDKVDFHKYPFLCTSEIQLCQGTEDKFAVTCHFRDPRKKL